MTSATTHVTSGTLPTGHPGNIAQLQSLRLENESLRRQVRDLQMYRRLAYRDALTGLGNRRSFEERLAEEMDRARRHEHTGFSVIVIDINDFKSINDNWGHSVGDQTLRRVAKAIGGSVRRHDVCFRTGGDEFVLLCPEAVETDCRIIVSRLRRKLHTVGIRRGFALTFGAGSASWGADAFDADRLLEMADQAMYRDKRRQKGLD